MYPHNLCSEKNKIKKKTLFNWKFLIETVKISVYFMGVLSYFLVRSYKYQQVQIFELWIKKIHCEKKTNC